MLEGLNVVDRTSASVCYNPLELLWEDSMEFLKEASECNRSLGAPLTTEQLLLGAERMK